MPFVGAPLDTPCEPCGGIMEYSGTTVQNGFSLAIYCCEGCAHTISRSVGADWLVSADPATLGDAR